MVFKKLNFIGVLYYSFIPPSLSSPYFIHTPKSISIDFGQSLPASPGSTTAKTATAEAATKAATTKTTAAPASA